ncbi:MAG: hypothetical protein WA761_11020 [Thermoplasmata archaeon]
MAAVLLLASVFLGWYVTTFSGSNDGVSVSESATFVPGQTVTYSFSCSGSVACPASNQTTYSNLGLNQTGKLYLTTQILLILGFILGFIGAIVLFVARAGFRARRSIGMALVVLGLIVAIATPMMLLALQPNALHTDSFTTGANSTSSPATSFFGSCSGSTCGLSGNAFNASETWGPGIGWYLAIVAFVLFVPALASASRIPKVPPNYPTMMAPPVAYPPSSPPNWDPQPAYPPAQPTYPTSPPPSAPPP